MSTRQRKSYAENAAIITCIILIALAIALAMEMFWLAFAEARDLGQYAQVDPSIRQWFNGLKAGGNGIPCCSYADGLSITDADWDTQGDHYRVRVDGQWYDVPPEAVITEPNKVGTAVVWPWADGTGVVHIRCFIPGSGV